MIYEQKDATGRAHDPRALVVGGFLAVRYTRQVSDGSDVIDRRATPRQASLASVSSRIPRQIPDLTMTTLDGKTITNKDLAGKGRDLQLLGDLVRAVPGRDSGSRQAAGSVQGSPVVIIGVLSEDDPGPHVSKFAADYKINYPIVPETKELEDAFPGIYALPTTFMVGPDLKMMQKHVGQIRPSQIELETRVLAKLPVDAEVEYERGR